MEKHCRLCSIVCSDYHSLYSNDEQPNHVHKLVEKYFSPEFFQVKWSKSFRNICHKCWSVLLNFNKFQEIVSKAQNVLKELDASTTSELVKENTDNPVPYSIIKSEKNDDVNIQPVPSCALSENVVQLPQQMLGGIKQEITEPMNEHATNFQSLPTRSPSDNAVQLPQQIVGSIKQEITEPENEHGFPNITCQETGIFNHNNTGNSNQGIPSNAMCCIPLLATNNMKYTALDDEDSQSSSSTILSSITSNVKARTNESRENIRNTNNAPEYAQDSQCLPSTNNQQYTPNSNDMGSEVLQNLATKVHSSLDDNFMENLVVTPADTDCSDEDNNNSHENISLTRKTQKRKSSKKTTLAKRRKTKDSNDASVKDNVRKIDITSRERTHAKDQATDEHSKLKSAFQFKTALEFDVTDEEMTSDSHQLNVATAVPANVPRLTSTSHANQPIEDNKNVEVSEPSHPNVTHDETATCSRHLHKPIQNSNNEGQEVSKHLANETVRNHIAIESKENKCPVKDNIFNEEPHLEQYQQKGNNRKIINSIGTSNSGSKEKNKPHSHEHTSEESQLAGQANNYFGDLSFKGTAQWFPIDGNKNTLKLLETREEYDDLIAEWRPHLECRLCYDVTYDKFAQLQQHFGQHHPNEECYIECCQLQLRYRYEIQQHIYYHQQQTAGEEHISATNSDNHSKVPISPTTPEKPKEIKCQISNRRYSMKTPENFCKVNNGDALSTSLQLFVCNECNRSFANHYRLSQHKWNYHSVELKTEQCPICDRIVHSSYRLKVHMKQHAANRKYHCEWCPISFGLSIQLDSHCKRKHIQEYRIKRRLEQPEVKREPANIYSCDKCDKTFGNRGSLYIHRLQHTHTPLQFKCQWCPNEYSSLAGIYKHTKMKHATRKKVRYAEFIRTE
ncbi:uncharacterized protein isoform X2 [Musca autumnalis]|uniref:uncharacterized protein isoform X2 n=1 Tax=Musca autumnalis TaxID=221902 RepID=UPI003CEA7587